MRRTVLLTSLIFFGFFVKSQEVIHDFNRWIETTSLQGFCSATEELDDSTLVLFVGSDDSTPAELKRYHATWDSLSSSSSEVGIDLSAQLILKYAQLKGTSVTDLQVNVSSVLPFLFSIEITFSDQKVSTVVNYVGGKGEKINSLKLTEGGFDPKEFFVFRRSSDQVKRLIEERVGVFLKDQWSIKKSELVFRQINAIQFECVIAVKSKITNKYFERHVISFWVIASLPQESEVIYELSGAYAAGIINPGAYRDIKREYFAELMAFNQLLKETIYQAARDEG